MILLDTHALVWWLMDEKRLSARARREISRADVVLVSPVTFWEAGLLVARGRLRLDRTVFEWIRDIYDDDRVSPAELTPDAAAGAALLPDDFPADPADRLLYCTARDLAVPFVTKDARLIDYAREAGDVRAVW